MHSVHLQVTFTENYEKWIKHNWSQFTLKIHHIHTQHVNTDTWEKMCLEALLGYSIVRFEFNSHIVELGRDHFRHLSSTESAMQFRLRGKTAPNLHIIVFANLEKTWSLESPDLKVPDDLHLFLRNVSCFSLFIPMIVKLELKGKEKKINKKVQTWGRNYERQI